MQSAPACGRWLFASDDFFFKSIQRTLGAMPPPAAALASNAFEAATSLPRHRATTAPSRPPPSLPHPHGRRSRCRAALALAALAPAAAVPSPPSLPSPPSDALATTVATATASTALALALAAVAALAALAAAARVCRRICACWTRASRAWRTGCVRRACAGRSMCGGGWANHSSSAAGPGAAHSARASGSVAPAAASQHVM